MKLFFASLLFTLCLSYLTQATLSTSFVEHSHARNLRHRSTYDEKKDHFWLQQKLFPPEHTYCSGFTTAFGVFLPGVSLVTLDDGTLNVIKVTKGLTHDIVWENRKFAWEAIYPNGSWNPSNTPRGGFGFYLGGTDDFVNAIADGAEDVILGYSVMFEKGFEFNKGGKLPGAFGGEGDLAFGCSGGRQENRSKCFDARLMWRTDGAGEVYTYIPLTEENDAAQLAVPGTVADSSYGYSVGRGSFTFPTGRWLTIAQRVKLNTVGKYDGLIDLWVDGKKTIELHNISLRESANATIQGSHFQTFFGGGTSDWASPKTQKAWFADVSGAVIKY